MKDPSDIVDDLYTQFCPGGEGHEPTFTDEDGEERPDEQIGCIECLRVAVDTIRAEMLRAIVDVCIEEADADRIRYEAASGEARQRHRGRVEMAMQLAIRFTYLGASPSTKLASEAAQRAFDRHLGSKKVHRAMDLK